MIYCVYNTDKKHMKEYYTEKEHTHEQLTLPENIDIIFEKNMTLASVMHIIHGENLPQPQEEKHPEEYRIVKKCVDFFAKHPVSTELHKKISDIITHIDEDTLLNIVLSKDHPARTTHTKEFIRKYKEPIENDTIFFEKVFSTLAEIETLLPQELLQEIDHFTQSDVEKRTRQTKELRKNLQGAIDFFRPQQDLCDIKKLYTLTTDPLYSPESGMAFNFGAEHIIHSHIDNIENTVHEFAHIFINPMIDRVTAHFTKEQKQKIIHLSSQRLRYEQGYGEHPESLLCEELIRAYTKYLFKNEPFRHLDEITERINHLTDEDFARIQNTHTTQKNNRLEKIGIHTLDELKEHVDTFYTYYIASPLESHIYALYKKYEKEMQRNPHTHFEKFLTQHSNELLED